MEAALFSVSGCGYAVVVAEEMKTALDLFPQRSQREVRQTPVHSHPHVLAGSHRLDQTTSSHASHGTLFGNELRPCCRILFGERPRHSLCLSNCGPYCGSPFSELDPWS